MENFQSQVSDVEIEDDEDDSEEEEKDVNEQESELVETGEAAPGDDNAEQRDDEEEEIDGDDNDNSDDENEENDDDENQEEDIDVDQDENILTCDKIKDESDVLFGGENKINSIDLTSNINGDPTEDKKKAIRKRKAGTMVGDIQEMMYGFGDTHFPSNEDSVALIQSLITNFIEDLTWRASEVADIRSKDGLDKESFLFLVRKDKVKFNRVFKLLKANNELKAAQKLQIREDHPSML